MSLLLHDALRWSIHMPLPRAVPGSCTLARHLCHGAGAMEQLGTATPGVWKRRGVSGGMIWGCRHHFLPSQRTNRRRGASGWLGFQDVDQQLGEV